ncbi:MAG: hypothetical protein JSW13_01730 [Candidatus Aerophobus sp.]|nr:MAG: hypothetical protein JSW13_01730 [Candidatus Aerophobus sp.]
MKKIRFRSYHTVLGTDIKRGDIIDGYIFLQNKHTTILYIPAYKRILTGKIDGRCKTEIWSRISGWEQWDFDLESKDIAKLKKIL